MSRGLPTISALDLWHESARTRPGYSENKISEDVITTFNGSKFRDCRVPADHQRSTMACARCPKLTDQNPVSTSFIVFTRDRSCRFIKNVRLKRLSIFASLVFRGLRVRLRAIFRVPNQPPAFSPKFPLRRRGRPLRMELAQIRRSAQISFSESSCRLSSFEASSERRVVERIHHLSSRITRNQTGKKTRP